MVSFTIIRCYLQHMNIDTDGVYKTAKVKYMYAMLKLQYILPLLYEAYLMASLCVN